MSSKALERLEGRMADARRLLAIHTECTGPGRGRRRNYDALSRSAVILAIAAWEGFSEDLVLQGASLIVRRLRSAEDLPANVRDGMLTFLHETHNWAVLNKSTKETIWGLTGQGWRTAYIAYVRHKVTALHTPSAENLRKLFSATCGLQDVTSGWGSGRWPAEHYRSEMQGALTIRHRIAHGSIGEQTVGKAVAIEVIGLVERCAIRSADTLTKHLQTLPKRLRVRTPGIHAAVVAPLRPEVG